MGILTVDRLTEVCNLSGLSSLKFCLYILMAWNGISMQAIMSWVHTGLALMGA